MHTEMVAWCTGGIVAGDAGRVTGIGCGGARGGEGVAVGAALLGMETFDGAPGVVVVVTIVFVVLSLLIFDGLVPGLFVRGERL
jgi:hypothetical protein